MRKVKITKVDNILGKPMLLATEDSTPDNIKLDETTRLDDLLKRVVYNLPIKDLKMEDSEKALRVVSQIRNAKNGHMDFEDDDHKWLVNTLNKYGTQVFGVNAVCVRDALEMVIEDKKTEG